jgi:hypothetical protein
MKANVSVNLTKNTEVNAVWTYRTQRLRSMLVHWFNFVAAFIAGSSTLYTYKQYFNFRMLSSAFHVMFFEFTYVFVEGD